MITASDLDRDILADFARRWSEAGFAVVPVSTDGEKRPDLAQWASMGRGEEPPMDIESVVARIFMETNDGIGLLMGLPSGNAEMMELESRGMSRYGDLATHAQHTGVFHLFDRLMRGCVERTPSGGIHAYLRVSDGPALGNTGFAKRPRSPGEDNDPVLAESRGQGGYSICAPSGGRTHSTGQPYTFLMGGPESVPAFTLEERDQLHDLFRFLDEMPPQVEEPREFDPPERVGNAGGCDGDLRPGDDFNQRGKWEDILGGVGWTKVYTQGEGTENQRTHWRRPGKSSGTSATTGGEGDWLYVFSTSTELPAERAMTKFTVYAHLHHHGDFQAAAAELARQGYGAARTGVHSGGAASIPEYVPFPTDALVEPLRAFVEATATAASCDPAFVALPAFAALASAIGNSRRLLVKDSWAVPPIIWTASVAESGSQKTTGYLKALAPLEERQAQAFRRQKEAYREYEQQLEFWKRTKREAAASFVEKPEPPIAERYMVGDTTVEALATLLQQNPHGILLARDELKGWIGSFDRYAANGKSESDEAHYLAMYNGSSLFVDRKSGDQKSIYVPSASVCITGGIQPGTLRRALDVRRRESGLAARLLMAYPPRRRKQWTDASIPYEITHAYSRLFDHLYSLTPIINDSGDPKPVGIRMTAQAQQLFIDYFKKHNDEQVEMSGDMAALWSKLEETVARLALVTHYIRWAGGDTGVERNTVDEADIAYGILLVMWFKDEAKRIYAMLGGGEQEDYAQKLVDWLKGRGGEVTVREVQQGCRWLKGSGQAEAALSSLVDAGLGQWVIEQGRASGSSGRRFVLGNTRRQL
jgi:hypothetical protein